MRKLFGLLIVAAAAVVLVIPATASAGSFLSIRQGKSEIRWRIAQTQLPTSTQFASRIDTCYKPRHDRVRCFWQSREWDMGEWYICFGIATATDRWNFIAVNLGPNWVDNCYPSYDPTFV